MKHHREQRSKWETGEAYVGTGMSPRAQAVKSLEMSARRAWHLGRLIALYTARHDHVFARTYPLERALTTAEERAAKEAFGDTRVPRWLTDPGVWRWVYGLWQSGNLEASIEDVLVQIPEENAERARRAITT